MRVDVESVRCQKNELAKQARSGITPELREQSIAVGKQLKEKEKKYERIFIYKEYLRLFENS